LEDLASGLPLLLINQLLIQFTYL